MYTFFFTKKIAYNILALLQHCEQLVPLHTANTTTGDSLFNSGLVQLQHKAMAHFNRG